MQKKRNLLKFLAYVAPDGHFIEVLGPYFSNGAFNDEWLNNEALTDSKCSEFFESFESDDEFLFDRGFQRCEKAFNFHAPRSISMGKTSLEAEDAKNHFFEALFKNDPIQDNLDLEILMTHNFPENEVKNIVERLPRRSAWRIVSLSDILSKLEKQWIHSWNAGMYVLRLASSYISQIDQLKLEMQDVNGDILFRVKGISSRFQKRKHVVYVVIAGPVFDSRLFNDKGLLHLQKTVLELLEDVPML
jgi:hypothetical protein